MLPSHLMVIYLQVLALITLGWEYWKVRTTALTIEKKILPPPLFPSSNEEAKFANNLAIVVFFSCLDSLRL